MSPAPPPQLWFFQPGNVNGQLGPVPGNYASNFRQIATVAGDPRDGLPAPRGHSTFGVYGDNIFVFGGVASVGGVDTTLNDLWVMNMPSQTWNKIGGQTPGQPWPMPRANTRPAGVIIGRWLYVMVVTDPAVTGAPNQLWRWTFPIFRPGGGGGPPGGGGGGGGASSQGEAIAVGHTWGIVIGLLIGLANLALLVVLVRGGSGGGFSFGFSLPTSLSAGPPSFYSSAGASASAAAGGYTAPSDGAL